MNNQIPAYTITKRDFEDAKLLIHKFEQTEWELKDLILEVIRKYAHMSETARSLQYLPAMKEVEGALDEFRREMTYAYESEQSNFFIRKHYYMEHIEPLRKHMYELSKQFHETATTQAVVEE